MVKILFVCHGNICRSAMAECIMAHMVRERGLEEEIAVDSAATSTEEIGNPIYPPAARKLREKGVDRETAEAVLGEEEDETETVRGIIESGYLRKLSGEDGYRKVFAALARRGFRSADIRRALAFYTEEGDDGDE